MSAIFSLYGSYNLKACSLQHKILVFSSVQLQRLHNYPMTECVTGPTYKDSHMLVTVAMVLNVLEILHKNLAKTA